MFLGIVMFGLLHGLCILPVYLSLLCRKPAFIGPHTVPRSSSEESLTGRVPRMSNDMPSDSDRVPRMPSEESPPE